MYFYMHLCNIKFHELYNKGILQKSSFIFLPAFFIKVEFNSRDLKLDDIFSGLGEGDLGGDVP